MIFRDTPRYPIQVIVYFDLEPPMRRAFTLVELLVVIAIITLLIAILLPVLKNVKYSVKVDICKSNLRQVGIGVFAYVMDNDQYYPNGHISGGWLNPDGEYARDANYSWAVYETSSGQHGTHDLVAILADYYGGVDGMRDTYMCSFMEDGYKQTMRETDKLWYGTNSGQQPFSLMWNIQGRNSGSNVPSKWGVQQGMYRLGDRWQQGESYQNYDYMWYNILAGDKISPSQYGGARANHWNLGNPKPFLETSGAGGFQLDPDEPTNGNFLLDDGSVHNHNNMQRDQDHVGGTGGYMVPGEYATRGPLG